MSSLNKSALSDLLRQAPGSQPASGMNAVQRAASGAPSTPIWETTYGFAVPQAHGANAPAAAGSLSASRAGAHGHSLSTMAPEDLAAHFFPGSSLREHAFFPRSLTKESPLTLACGPMMAAAMPGAGIRRQHRKRTSVEVDQLQGFSPEAGMLGSGNSSLTSHQARTPATGIHLGASIPEEDHMTSHPHAHAHLPPGGSPSGGMTIASAAPPAPPHHSDSNASLSQGPTAGPSVAQSMGASLTSQPSTGYLLGCSAGSGAAQQVSPPQQLGGMALTGQQQLPGGGGESAALQLHRRRSLHSVTALQRISGSGSQGRMSIDAAAAAAADGTDALTAPLLGGNPDSAAEEGALPDGRSGLLAAFGSSQQLAVAGPSGPQMPQDKGLLNAVSFGIINAVVSMPTLIAYAAIVFKAPIYSNYLGSLCKFFFFSSAVHQLVFVALSTLPFAIGQVQDVGLIFLSAMASDIALQVMGDEQGPEVALGTSLLCMTVATFVVGLLTVLVARFRLADLVQYVPLPVVGGYLGYVGYFCIAGGTALGAGVQIDTLLSWVHLFALDPLVKLLPTAATIAALMLCVEHVSHPLALPGLLTAIPLAFHAVLWAVGWDLAKAQEMKWVMPPTEGGQYCWQLWEMFNLVQGGRLSLAGINMSAALAQLPKLVGLFLVVCFGSCMDVAAIQSDMPTPLDFNKELMTVGVSNMVTGALGAGYTGSYIFSQTVFTMRQRVFNRVNGLMVAATELLVWGLPFSVVQYMPNFYFGALLVWFGIEISRDWLVLSYRKLSRAEYVLLWLSFLAIMQVGLELGIAGGIVMATLYFAFQYAQSQVSGLRQLAASSGRMHGDRATAASLELLSRRMAVLQLQGYIFFGSSTSLGNQILQVAGRLLQERAQDVAEQQDLAFAAREREDEQRLARTKPPSPPPAGGPPAAAAARMAGVNPGCEDEEEVSDSERHARSAAVLQYAPLCIILDFRQVTGMDSTGARTFATLVNTLASQRVAVIFASMRPDAPRALLAGNGLPLLRFGAGAGADDGPNAAAANGTGTNATPAPAPAPPSNSTAAAHHPPGKADIGIAASPALYHSLLDPNLHMLPGEWQATRPLPATQLPAGAASDGISHSYGHSYGRSIGSGNVGSLPSATHAPPSFTAAAAPQPSARVSAGGTPHDDGAAAQVVSPIPEDGSLDAAATAGPGAPSALSGPSEGGCWEFPSVVAAVRRCEDEYRLMAVAGGMCGAEQHATSLQDLLARLIKEFPEVSMGELAGMVTALEGSMTRCVLRRGDVLLEEGDCPRHLFLIEQGTLKAEELLLLPTPGGGAAQEEASRTLGFRSTEYGPGCVVGAAEFFLNKPAPMSVRCSSGVARLLRLSRSAHAALLADQPRALAAMQVLLMRSTCQDLQAALEAAQHSMPL